MSSEQEVRTSNGARLRGVQAPESVNRREAQEPVVYLEDEIDLLDYIEVLVRRRWLLAAGVVIGVLSVVVFARPQVPLYQAEAVLLTGEVRHVLAMRGGESGFTPPFSYADVLESTQLNRNVVERKYEYVESGKKVKKNFLAYAGAENLQQGIGALRGVVDFTLRKDMLSISVVTLYPDLSAAIANEYVAQLLDFKEKRYRVRVQNRLAFIENRLAEVQAELAEAEKLLAEFRSRNRNFALNGERAVFLMPKQASVYSRLQREVQTRSSILSTILERYEISRLESRNEIPEIEVLAYAKSSVASLPTGMKRIVLIASAVGLLAAIFLAFVLEFLERNVQSGRMDSMLKELDKDVQWARQLLGR